MVTILRPLALAVTVLLLIGCGNPKPAAPPLKTYGQIGADHRFTERSGKSITTGDLRGAPWIASFIFTTCPGPCPRITAQVAALQDSLADVSGLRFVSFTIDPEHDVPDTLRAYADRFHADPSRWLFLTGDKAETYRMANDEFKLSVGDAAGMAMPSGSSMPMMHATKLALVDADGYIRAYRDALDPAATAALIADVRTLTRPAK